MYDIGESLGGFMEFDDSDPLGWCEFMRLKVMIDVRKPLRRGVFIACGGPKSKWVDIKYERLGEFCFSCGMLDHIDKECAVKEGESEASRAVVYQYGTWLRESPLKPSVKNFKVSGKNEYGVRSCNLSGMVAVVQGKGKQQFVWVLLGGLDPALIEKEVRLDKSVGDGGSEGIGAAGIVGKKGDVSLTRQGKELESEGVILKQGKDSQLLRRKKRLFRFEAMWLSREDCGEVVSKAWSDGEGRGPHARIALCAEYLKKWAATSFGTQPSGWKEHTMVNELMVEGCVRWDATKICELFDNETTTLILANPLSTHHARDTMYWSCTKNGIFSVKSGYWLARDVMDVVGDVGSNEDCWRSVWNIQGPPKLKHFLWGAVKGNLAVRDRLVQRHIITYATCQICGGASETIIHSLFDCTAA
uniref:Reverse transcriptase zinc-binding domain-containing protein n=1 Tax=Chenopodium quinoa TaxID=63459 RepID=A0A803MBU7_CHEQI